jgi:formylglycine-generating enzyme required for sulfatase activity
MRDEEKTFAISAKAVTVGEFKRRRQDYQRLEDVDLPVAYVSWYEAAEYCNQLSAQEGLRRCFEPIRNGKCKEHPDCLERTGYRLPTEAEMEYAIRAGAETSRFYGEPEELLVKYGWILKNFKGSAPVGSLKPNDFGLFDMHGNVWCWCLEADREYPRGERRQKDNELELARMVRGNCCTDLAKDVHFNRRWSMLPGDKTNLLGFWLARTMAR